MPGDSPDIRADGVKLRHRIMSSNHGRTQPERALASALWRKGLRYYTWEGYRKIAGVKLPGSPDLVFPRCRIAVFLDGCFWHGCPQCKGTPSQSGAFWRKKIETNHARDGRVDAALSSIGWRVIRIWEHDVKSASALSETANRLAVILG